MQRRDFIKNGMIFTVAGMAGSLMLKSTNSMASSSFLKQNLLPKQQSPMNYQNVSTVVKLKGKDVKVHALCTGTVAVKTAFRTKKGSGAMAKLNILLDERYTEFMPIWLWIIEHPQGIIAIDTGEIFAAQDINKYLEKESGMARYQFKHAAKYKIAQEDELNYQLATINLKPSDVNLVVLTHLHLDHTDGIKFFPNQEILVGETEFKHPHSNMPSTYPTWFKPNLVNYKAGMVQVFDKAHPLTQAGDLLYLPTPGHTHGHSSVMFRTDDVDIMFAGDTSYNQEQVLKGELAGVNKDFGESKDTYKKILAYAAAQPTIYLPTHDGNAGNRLLHKTLITS